MRKKSPHTRRRGRRAGILGTFAVLVSMLVASAGAAPAQGATQTAWIPLHCTLFGTGGPTADVAATLTATFPDSVAPGDTFNLTNVSTEVVFPPDAQTVGAISFNADLIEGIVSEFWTSTTNATTAFAPTPVGAVNSSPNLFNSVGAVQPPNQPASVPEVNGGDTTRAGFQPATPPETFSFGDVPVDPAQGNAFAPAPGHGGGFVSGAGTPVILPPIGPITVDAGATGDVTITTVNGPLGFAAVNKVSFHNKTSLAWSAPVQANCETGGVATNPDPTRFVDVFTIPIGGGPTDGVGTASARGTDPDAGLGTGTVAAQYSAITNCDETQNSRPFIVRWTEGTTTHTFRRTTTDTSTCQNVGGSNTNSGTGGGQIDGSTAATVSWTFTDNSPDDVQITITPGAGSALTIGGEPQPLSGTPGGVWTFPTGTWPAGT